MGCRTPRRNRFGDVMRELRLPRGSNAVDVGAELDHGTPAAVLLLGLGDFAHGSVESVVVGAVAGPETLPIVVPRRVKGDFR